MIVRRGKLADGDSSFTAGRSYGVLGISRYEGRLMVLVRDDHRLPVWTELSDFEVDGVEPTPADGGDEPRDSRECSRVRIDGSDGHALTLEWPPRDPDPGLPVPLGRGL
ncbi:MULTISPECIES: hypothetical protein [unclassified Streptomyces]|uniref:hypothetical protein n=1 Tax=unclassified Streptomyces TaxID=2593676 RepID=UPI003CF8F4F8